MRRIHGEGYSEVMDWETIVGLKNSVKNEKSNKRQGKNPPPRGHVPLPEPQYALIQIHYLSAYLKGLVEQSAFCPPALN